MIDTTLAWLATYLIHSSALILAVWGFTRWCSLDPLTRSLLWKIALVGGLFTATLQTGLGVQPALGHIEVASQPAPAPELPVVEEVEIEDEVAAPERQQIVVLEVDDGEQAVTIVSLHGNAGPAWEPMPMVPPIPPPPPLPGTTDAAPAEGGGLSAALLGLFLGGAILGVGRLAFTARRLRRLLHGRTDILRGSLAERLAVLLARARLGRRAVRLTMSPALVSPIALASREIVVPEEASSLEVRQQEAMLAHELAHVVRQDPAWLVLAAVIEAALFIQPLNRLARAGMQEAAEELADDWAVRHLGTGLHLARCLTKVASWHSRATPGPFVSPMASGNGSALVQRVTRLLDDRSRERGPWAGAGRLLFAGALLAAVAWGAPGISVGLAQAEDGPVVIEDEDDEFAEFPDLDVEDMAFAPMLAMNTLVDDTGPAVVTAAEPSGRDRRMHRRAARLERKAAKARAKAATLRGDGDAGNQVIVVRDDRVHITRDGGQVVIIPRSRRGR
jgi:beta-lactamase regulating signal transducer with metallopeptidase domain